jgi:hypothetical protein
MRARALSSRQAAPLGIVLALVIASAIPCRGATIYTNESDFVSAIQSFPIYLNEFTNFDYLGQLVHPISVCETGICYQIYSQPPIHLVAFNGTVSTVQTNDQIVVNFSSGNVRAIGGEFFCADANGLPIDGSITLALSDGTTNSVTSQSNTGPSFIGFVSTGPVFTNVMIRSIGGTSRPAMSHFYAGIGLATLTSTLTATNTIHISWPAPRTGYVLQSCPDLVPPSWTNVTQKPLQNGSVVEVFVPVSRQHEFFRLEKQY